MPELPDLLHVLARLRERLAGRAVEAERVRDPVVLRCLVRGNLSLLLGNTLQAIERRGHFLIFRFAGLDLAVNPMLAGRFRLAGPGEPDEAALGFAIEFRPRDGDAPVELRYLDDKSMGKAYLVAAGDWSAIPAFHAGGIDVLSKEFTRERFFSLLRHRKDQVRVFLLDKKALDAIGNAYADEILFAAGIHPKTFCRKLDHDDGMRLHDAIVQVITEAAAEVEARDAPIEEKVRDFLKVRRKETCPGCQSKLRVAGVKGMDAWYCPRCQPETRPGLVDFRKTGK